MGWFKLLLQHPFKLQIYNNRQPKINRIMTNSKMDKIHPALNYVILLLNPRVCRCIFSKKKKKIKKIPIPPQYPPPPDIIDMNMHRCYYSYSTIYQFCTTTRYDEPKHRNH